MNRKNNLNAWAAGAVQALGAIRIATIAAVVIIALASCCDDDNPKPEYNRPPGYVEEITEAGQFSVTVDDNNHTHPDGTPVGEDAHIYLLDEDGIVVAEGLEPGVAYDVQEGTYTVLAVDIHAEEGTAPYTIENGVLRLGTYTRGSDFVLPASPVHAGRKTIDVSRKLAALASIIMEAYTRHINIMVAVRGANPEDIERCELTISRVAIIANLLKRYADSALSGIANLWTSALSFGLSDSSDGADGIDAVGSGNVRILGLCASDTPGAAPILDITFWMQDGSPVSTTMGIPDDFLITLTNSTESNPPKLRIDADVREDGSVTATITGWGNGWNEEVEGK